jgi:hypothetical protein
MNAKGSGRVVAGCDHPALIGTAANGKGQIGERGVVTHFNRRIKTIHVDMDEFTSGLLARGLRCVGVH